MARDIPTLAMLDAARQRGDAPADALAVELGPRVWALNAMLRDVRSNGDPLPGALPESVRDLLADSARLPAWLNRGRVLNAQHWAERHLFHITAALFCAALPSAYAAERGAKVLAATGRMASDLDRRVNETARFVLEVLRPGSLDPDGAALPAIAKVRLMHAAVRQTLRSEVEFSSEVPINQEDLLGTLLGFSVVVLRSVRRLGVPVQTAEAEDFYHLWRGIGAMLGVEAGLLPRDFASASRTADLIADRQFRESAHGRSLMATLLARTEAHFDVPGLRKAPAFLVRYLIGDRTAEILGVPAPAFDGLFSSSPRLPEFVRSSAQRLSLEVAPTMGRRLLEAVISVKLGSGAQSLRNSSTSRPRAFSHR